MVYVRKQGQLFFSSTEEHKIVLFSKHEYTGNIIQLGTEEMEEVRNSCSP